MFDSGSQKVQRESEKLVFSHLCNSITMTVHSKNSSDLDLGRRPELKSVEFSGVTRLVHEIMRGVRKKEDTRLLWATFLCV